MVKLRNSAYFALFWMVVGSASDLRFLPLAGRRIGLRSRTGNGNEPGDGNVRVIYSPHTPNIQPFKGTAALIVAGT